jgi:uncharacterized membrane protein
VPVELRYAGVALVGAFLLGLGWRLRARKDALRLILQGAGIGVFYLTALAAIKLHPLLPPALAFVFMALVALFGALLAVKQDAPWLALVAWPKVSPRRCWCRPAAATTSRCSATSRSSMSASS